MNTITIETTTTETEIVCVECGKAGGGRYGCTCCEKCGDQNSDCSCYWDECGVCYAQYDTRVIGYSETTYDGICDCQQEYCW